MGLAEELAKKRHKPGTIGYLWAVEDFRELLEFAAQEAEKECADLGERAVGFHVAARIRKLKE